jgi:hypothetical protein
MTLKDKGGLVKMFAIAISDYTIVGVGNTMREVLNVTGVKLRRKKIEHYYSNSLNGKFYYFKDYPNICGFKYPQLPVTMIGDSVKISFDVDTEGGN